MTDNALEQIITTFLLEMRFCQRLCDSKFFEAKRVLADKAIMKGIYIWICLLTLKWFSGITEYCGSLNYGNITLININLHEAQHLPISCCIAEIITAIVTERFERGPDSS